MNISFTIVGIKHQYYEITPVNITFISGGVGHMNATINIESQKDHGINSTFTFYTV